VSEARKPERSSEAHGDTAMSGASGHILVAIDGSENALRALAFAIALAGRAPGTRIELVNAQVPVGQAVSMFLPRGTLTDFHRDAGMQALGPAIAAARQAGVAFAQHIAVGQPADVIAGFARELGCTHVVMGTRGLGAALGMLLGSVATAVVRQVAVPVTLVK